MFLLLRIPVGECQNCRSWTYGKASEEDFETCAACRHLKKHINVFFSLKTLILYHHNQGCYHHLQLIIKGATHQEEGKYRTGRGCRFLRRRPRGGHSPGEDVDDDDDDNEDEVG